MKLVVGLGNPSKEYDFTRHNVGFMVVDNYLNKMGYNDKFKEKFNSLYLDININSEKVIFLKPLTYMNNSGEAVRRFSDFYKINPEDILIISDDLNLDIGKFRLRSRGSSGGHNGLKSIINRLGSDNFKRLRVGIGKDNGDIVDYVLSKFSKYEMNILDEVIDNLVMVLNDYFLISFNDLMSRYNRRG